MTIHNGQPLDGSSPSIEAFTPSALQYIFHHVFLPPRLPQKDDSNAANDLALTHETLAALGEFSAIQSEDSLEISSLTRSIAMIKNMITSRTTEGTLLVENVEAQMGSMEDNDVLAFHLRAQNAALYIRRHDDRFTFETFEVSCPNAMVTRTQGCLRRIFPTEAITISAAEMDDKTFREPFAEMLAKMDDFAPEDAYRIARKANKKLAEIRDAVNPRYFTEMAFGILRGMGQPADIPRIQKHVRDDVLWSDTFGSWRRSPLWTVLRVALQTTFMRHNSNHPDIGRVSYKVFMAYLMARTLDSAVKKNMPSDMVRCMQSKIVRRFRKLSSTIDRPAPAQDSPSWANYVEQTIRQTTKVLEHRWHREIEETDPFKTQSEWNPSSLKFHVDTILRITNLEKYCCSIDSRQVSHISHTAPDVHYYDRMTMDPSVLPDTSLLATTSGDALRLLLADVESWTHKLLPTWQIESTEPISACSGVANVIKEYTSCALTAYSGDPESLSIMFLTAMELWVCLDKMATADQPLLLEYETEFTPNLFEPLLLPKRCQMERLLKIEQHISHRNSHTDEDYPSVFDFFGARDSIAVQFFDRSESLLKLRLNIEQQAAATRKQKKQELMQKAKEHAELKDKAARVDHTIRQRRVWNRYTAAYEDEEFHAKNCQKCAWDDQASRMQIALHEWPLPTCDLQAKAVVFELDCPKTISIWRDLTYYMLVDVLTAPAHKPYDVPSTGDYPLRTYDGLSYFYKSRISRIELASAAKPFVVSHYRSLKVVHATEDNVCVENGLRYDVHDSENRKLAREFLGFCGVRDECTPTLRSPYHNLQYSVSNTTHFPNQVIADQSDCPPELTIHEYLAFGHIRAGHRLQWQNIGLALVDGNLNLNQEATRLLFTQAAWQAGPSAPDGQSVLRDSHVVLGSVTFCTDILQSLESALNATRENWQGTTSVKIFIALTQRILSLSPHAVIREQCLKLLDETREVTLSWTRQLTSKLRECVEDDQRDLWTNSALEVALTCFSTFAVDSEYALDLLKSQNTVAALTECAITIHDLCPAVTTGLPPTTRLSLSRSLRIARALETTLHQVLSQDTTGLDRSIKNLWTSYHPGAPWRSVEEGKCEWMVAETVGNGDNTTVPVYVHYNLLTGSLLVKGSPLSRLPRSYESHKSYQRLFGQRSINVVPSTMKGMKFESRDKQFGYQVHFAMHEAELIIRAETKRQCFEIIPNDSLQEDFPPAFKEDYLHWLEVGTNKIEFKPLHDPWTSRSHNWTIQNWRSQERRLVKGHVHHVDLHSLTASAIYKVLSPLEQPSQIHVSFTPKKGDREARLETRLVRFKLDFFLNHNLNLECKQRRGMIIDENQSCGTFTSLRNKLLLRSIKDSSRCIMVPSGTVNAEMRDSRVEVGIDSGTKNDVAYFYFELDALLWRVTDNGSLTSCLFRTLLHAYTSHCLPDKFTGLTGTEQAIANLREAGTHSFRVLNGEEIKILGAIAALTPRRFYYPRELRLMQQVEWHSGLPSLSQHESFSSLVFEIFQRARDQRILYQPNNLPDQSKSGESALLTKAVVRNSTFRVPGFGAENYSTNLDSQYSGEPKAREMEICTLSKLVNEWSRGLHGTTTLLRDLERWGEPIKGKNYHRLESLGYDEFSLGATNSLPELWCSIVNYMSRTNRDSQKYRLMIFLSTLAYSGEEDSRVCQTLLSFATVHELRELVMPDYAEYDLAEGYEPKRSEIRNIIFDNAKGFWSCPESDLPMLDHELGWDQAHARRTDLHSEAQRRNANDLTEHIMTQWPSTTIHIPARYATYFSLDPIMTAAGTKFSSWFRNKEFKTFIERAQKVLNRLRPSSRVVESYTVPIHRFSSRSAMPAVDWNMLFNNQPPEIRPIEDLDVGRFLQREAKARDCHKTQNLLHRMSSGCTGKYETHYSQDMLRSLDRLQEAREVSKLRPNIQKSLPNALRVATERVEDHISTMFHAVRASFAKEASLPDITAHDALFSSRLSPITLLRHLSCSETIPSMWKSFLVRYGRCLTKLQYYKRLAAVQDRPSDLLKELINIGHIGWDAEQYPEWLVFEVENNILIRPAQAKVAKEMLTPSTGGNSVMQLNMGEGKSSVIVPIVAVTIAKEERLSRVVVLPALSVQMFHILRQKLGGMLNRRVVVMPFSRSVQLSPDEAALINRLYQNLLKEKCIVLCQPEHILSFDLMGIEKSIDKTHANLGSTLVETQHWLDRNTRDILDESDEILNVKFELIYTMGLQKSIDFGPYRWNFIADILGVLLTCLRDGNDALQQKFPDGLKMHKSAEGEFPRLQILQSQAGEMLLRQVAEKIVGHGMPNFHVWTYQPEDQKALLDYITDPHQPEPLNNSGLSLVFESAQKRSILLLLKGCFAHGVLLFAFQHKRWRVNYGHDFSRSMLAVPYRAKDLPALRAEFSHPDVTILLTCLSYYYQGLSDQQLFLCFAELFSCNDPQGQYDSWVSKTPGVPEAFKELKSINLTDRPQCIQGVFRHIRRSKVVIDFYMSQLVFPKEMKEFPEKLSSSGWDIARTKHHPTTGFSGTNDSRYILPLTVKQADIPDQVHTNATVLDCLLQPRNTFEIIPDSGETSNLLDLVVRSETPVRVILDVGALVLDSRNDEMARRWLKRVPSAEVEGVIYFDDHDELVVFTQDGRLQPLQESPMQTQMDRCLVYLDEAHTRGTDLKLPADYRAAVTLGVGLTKDRLVQACMRMRKLAQGQSVMLCAPPEIHRKIVDYVGKPPDVPIDVEDVLIWCIANTHDNTRKCVPLWAIQGLRHQKRNLAWNGEGNPESILEQEAKSLRDWYEVRDPEESNTWLRRFGDDVFSGRQDEVRAIQAKMDDFGVSSIDDAALHEEQERELSPESELERQLERPPKMTPAKHSLHKELVRMVNQGWLDPESPAFVPAFQSLQNTAAAKKFDLPAWPKGLLVTEDFARTIKAASNQEQDEFIRPVRWILSSPSRGTSAIISPFEANELFSQIRRHDSIALHIYSPRTRESMRQLDHLDYCAVPDRRTLSTPPDPAFQMQLNIFAGQLYFCDREQYVSVCRFLGLAIHAPDEGTTVFVDGFVKVEDRERFDQEMARVCTMEESPVDMLRTLMELRRKGQGLGKTHMAKLLGGEQINESHFSA